ncbi:hypothetical protein B0H14DRAFT_2557029 [Mycena olivaceomarginata]|nr:hypothetical protein B0H14DRAFT_2557029 [Mycena olivaceomarginata]
MCRWLSETFTSAAATLKAFFLAEQPSSAADRGQVCKHPLQIQPKPPSGLSPPRPVAGHAINTTCSLSNIFDHYYGQMGADPNLGHCHDPTITTKKVEAQIANSNIVCQSPEPGEVVRPVTGVGNMNSYLSIIASLNIAGIEVQ